MCAWASFWVARHQAPTDFLTAVWATLVLASFAGWGRLWHRLVLPELRVSWPLAAALGVAWACTLGGALLAVGVVSRGLVLALVLLGLLPFCASLQLPRRGVLRALKTLSRRLRLNWPLWICLGFAAFWLVRRLLWSIETFDYNTNDDFIAYFSYPRRMLDSGEFTDPFSFRRLGAYGGQSFLQAMVQAGTADVYRIQVFDTGISELIVVGMLLTHARRNTTAKIAALLSFLLLITLPNLRINAASAMSGVVPIAAMMQTYDLALREGKPISRGVAVTLGMLGAALCTLRQNYMVTAAVLLAFMFLANLWSSARARALREGFASLVIAAATCFAALVPWGWVSFRSHRTFLFPLTKGTFNTAFEFSQHETWKALGSRLWAQIGYVEQVRTLPLFALAGLLAAQAHKQRGYTAVVLSSIVGFVAVVVGYPIAPLHDMSRYLYANAVALAVFALPAMAGGLTPRRPAMRLPFALALLATVLHLHEIKDIDKPPYAHGVPFDAEGQDPQRKQYEDAQRAIPRGARVLAMVEKPYWFDFGRNVVDLIDIPGGASPPPGAPWLDGPAKLERYLVERKVGYLVYMKFDLAHDLYRRSQWVGMVGTADPFFHAMVTYMLATMDAFEQLTKERGRVFESELLVVVKLDGPP